MIPLAGDSICNLVRYTMIDGLAGAKRICQNVGRTLAKFRRLTLQNFGLFASANQKRSVSAARSRRAYQQNAHDRCARSN
jgi:hypothetical protein